MTDAILTRQSVRKFRPDKLTEPEVTQLIAAFNTAPCGMHQTDVMQASVIKDDAYLNKIEDACDHACYDAPLLFVIATKADSQFGERDASVAAENIMVEANSIGLGSVYVMGAAFSIDKDVALKKELGIDEGYKIQVIVSVGYPKEKPEAEDRSNRYKVTIK